MLVEFEEFGDALALSHGFDGEAVGGHHSAVVVLVGNNIFAPKSLVVPKTYRTFVPNMKNDNTIESQIASVLSDIHQKGYSSVQPFSIGKVEERMMQFAQANNVILASDELYMSAKQLQHSMRTSKDAKGLVIA